MGKRLYLIAVSWIGALAGLMLLTLTLTANTPTQITRADSPVPVSITESGFDPSVVTIPVETAVVWTNHTQEIVHLTSGEPYRIHLPLVLQDAGGTRAVATSPLVASAVVAWQQDDWGNVDIAPGESYTHTFTAAGNYPYFLTGHPDRTGLVIVQGAPTPDFALAVAPGLRTVTQGQSVTYTVALTATNSFSVPVMLSVSGLPSGATPTWTNNPVTPDDNTVLTINTAANTSTGTHTLTVSGTGGGQSHDVQTTLMVEPSFVPDFVLDAWPDTQTITRGRSITYTVAMTAVRGFTQAVNLDVGGTPMGAAVTWATNPLTPTAHTTLTITPSASGPTGTFTLIITGTSNPIHTAQVRLVVVAAPTPPVLDFGLGIQPSTREVVQGESVTYTVAVTTLNGFNNPVTLEIGGAPAGAAISWSTNPVTPNANTTLTITPALSSPTGTFTLIITGTGDGQVHTVTAGLSVAPRPDFELGIQPLAREVVQGESVTYTVAVTALYGFNSPVTLAVGGMPNESAVAWTTESLDPTTSGTLLLTPTIDAILTVTPSLSSPTGTYTPVITGTGGGQAHSLPFTLTVMSPPCPQAGAWSGITNEGYPITYTVSYAGGCQVDSGLVIKYRTNCFTAISTLNWDIPIENYHFDSGGNIPRVIGDFTSQTTATGTWSYGGPWPFPPYWCSGSGTWTASYGP